MNHLGEVFPGSRQELHQLLSHQNYAYIGTIRKIELIKNMRTMWHKSWSWAQESINRRMIDQLWIMDMEIMLIRAHTRIWKENRNFHPQMWMTFLWGRTFWTDTKWMSRKSNSLQKLNFQKCFPSIHHQGNRIELNYKASTSRKGNISQSTY